MIIWLLHLLVGEVEEMIIYNYIMNLNHINKFNLILIYYLNYNLIIIINRRKTKGYSAE